MKQGLEPPIFIVSTKAYIWGKKALELARAAERVAKNSIVNFIFIPQLVDLRMIAENVEIPVFAPNMDPINPGRGFGRDLPEALREAGASGVMINHAEREKTLAEVVGCLRRAREVGLRLIVCCDTPQSASALATLNPDAILSEPPKLIGTKRPVSKEMKQFIIDSVKAVKEVNRDILVIVGAGISCGEDAAEPLRLGADGSGASRAICESSDPERFLADVARAMERAWRLRTEIDETG